MPRKRRSQNLAAFLDFLIVAAIVAFSVLAPTGCNTLDSPYEDAERRVSASAAGAPSPAIVDAASSAQPLHAECVNFYLESEASDYFIRMVGEPRGDDIYCGDDPLYYMDQTWNCQAFGVWYTISRYSRDEEIPLEVRRLVIREDGDSWSFQCKYDNECLRIKCRRI